MIFCVNLFLFVRKDSILTPLFFCERDHKIIFFTFFFFETVHDFLSFPHDHWQEFFLLIFTSVKYCIIKLLKPERNEVQWKSK